MLLAVAGMKSEDIRTRAQKLASGDWSEFPPAESLAFSFALKMTKEPAAISRQDIQNLVKTFGENRTVDLVWHTAWCNYMTRVADALQFPLERENVFSNQQQRKPNAK